jgi:N-acyl-D-aspartate/D-glutamate deacylase
MFNNVNKEQKSNDKHYYAVQDAKNERAILYTVETTVEAAAVVAVLGRGVSGYSRPSVRQHLGDHVARAQAADAGCHGQTVIGHVHHAVQQRVHCQHLKKKTKTHKQQSIKEGKKYTPTFYDSERRRFSSWF